MNNYKQYYRAMLLILLLAGLLSSPGLAQNTQSVEQVKKQIEDLKSRATSYDSWSPALKLAYDKSLNALSTAYEKAVASEIQQLNDLLKVISEPTARQPLEEQLRQLKSFSQPSVPTNPAPPANASMRAASAMAVAIPTPTPAPTPTTFTLTVHTRVKGTGYPVDQAHIQLLRLKPNSDPPEFEVVQSGFRCKDKDKDGNDRGRCLTNVEKGMATLIIEIDVTEPPPTLKIAGLDGPYYPTVLDETIVPKADDSKTVYLDMVPKDAENYRAIVGVEQAGANGSEGKQSIFLDLFFSRPLIKRQYLTEPGSLCGRDRKEAKKLGYACNEPKHRIWGDFRVTSVPQPRQNLFQALDGSLGSTLNGAIGKIEDLDTGFSFLAGYQLRLTKGSLAASRFDFSLIAGGGAVGVLSPEKGVSIFNIPTDGQRLQSLKQKLRGELNSVDAANYINAIDGGKYNQLAFVPQGRDRFFRNYFGGLRFETHFGDTTPTRPAGMLDVTIGQDEAVTHGKLQGAVLRLDGFFPLPLGPGNLVYLFGTAQMALKRATASDTLLLPLADTTQTLTSATTLIIPVPAANRDLYRFGVGVNLFQLFSVNNKH